MKLPISFLLSLIGKLFGSRLKRISEGKLYAALAGRKRLIGAVLGAVAVGLVALGQNDAAEMLGSLAAIFMAAGILDAKWRESPMFSAPIWTFLRDHSADVMAILGGALAYFTTCSEATAALFARVHLTCGTGIAAVTVVTAVFTWALGTAATSAPPKVQA